MDPNELTIEEEGPTTAEPEGNSSITEAGDAFLPPNYGIKSWLLVWYGCCGLRLDKLRWSALSVMWVVMWVPIAGTGLVLNYVNLHLLSLGSACAVAGFFCCFKYLEIHLPY